MVRWLPRRADVTPTAIVLLIAGVTLAIVGGATAVNLVILYLAAALIALAVGLTAARTAVPHARPRRRTN